MTNATPDTTKPTVTGATVNGTALTITFSEDLAAAANLANSAFTVKKTPQSGSEQTVSLSGTPTISGKTVTLTLASAVVDTDTGVKVSYAVPATGSDNRLKDAADNEVDGFTDQAVTNVTADTTKPTVTGATVNGTALTITFSEDLAAAANLANSAFTVKKTPQSGSEQTVSLSGTPTISGKTVTLTLASAVVDTDTGVKVSYAVPATGSDNRLKDAADNEVDGFTDQAVTNATPDTTKPTVTGATVNGTALTITFSEDLAAAANLANSAFTVKKTPQSGSEQTVSLSGTPTISGKTVTADAGERGGGHRHRGEGELRGAGDGQRQPAQGRGRQRAWTASRDAGGDGEREPPGGRRAPGRWTGAAVSGTALTITFERGRWRRRRTWRTPRSR